MTLGEMRIEVARNLGLLSSDETTIIEDSRVTAQGITNKINQIYIDNIAQVLMNKYTHDFENESGQLPTYSESYSILSVTGTTLVSATDAFSQYDVGCQIQNPTDSNFVTIASYTSSTTVMLKEAPATNWVGNTVYTLNNYFPFDGDLVDVKEVVEIKVKYSPTASSYEFPEIITDENRKGLDNSDWSTSAPKWYYTNIQSDDGSSKRALAILPRPTNYNGILEIRYTARPPKMGLASDIPKLEVIGISETLILGATSWGLRLLGEKEESREYKNDYLEALSISLNSYRPKSKSGPFKVGLSSFYNRIQRGTNY